MPDKLKLFQVLLMEGTCILEIQEYKPKIAFIQFKI